MRGDRRRIVVCPSTAVSRPTSRRSSRRCIRDRPGSAPSSATPATRATSGTEPLRSKSRPGGSSSTRAAPRPPEGLEDPATDLVALRPHLEVVGRPDEPHRLVHMRERLLRPSPEGQTRARASSTPPARRSRPVPTSPGCGHETRPRPSAHVARRGEQRRRVELKPVSPSRSKASTSIRKNRSASSNRPRSCRVSPSPWYRGELQVGPRSRSTAGPAGPSRRSFPPPAPASHVARGSSSRRSGRTAAPRPEIASTRSARRASSSGSAVPKYPAIIS